MSRDKYIPNRDEEFVVWESTFMSKIATYVATLGLVQADVDAVVAAINDHRAGFQVAADARTTAQGLIHAAQNRRTDAEALIRQLVKTIKNSHTYNDAIGTDLGIIGAERIVDFNNAKPVVSQVLVHSDMVIIDWVKGMMEGVVIYGGERLADNMQTTPSSSDPDNPSGILQMAAQIQWEEIGRDLKSPFEDMRPNIGTNPEFRYYKLRYLRNDRPIGLDSDIIKVIVDIQPQG